MREKLSMSRKVGYGFGMFGESIAMNMFLTYFLFFLTDVVGMNPALSGTIVTVCGFWGAFTDLAAGAKSDASRNPKGKRGPFIFKSAILLGVAIFLIYSDWDFIPDNMKPVYFVAALLIFYFSLSFTDMPYQSLGSEITENAGERVQLRSIANVLNYVGMILASSGTLVLVTMFVNGGSSYSGAWSKVGLLFGVLTVIAYWLSVLAAKGKEPIPSEDEQVEKFSLVNTFKGYIEVMKLKAYRPFLLYAIFVYAGITLFSCMYIYYLNNNMGYTPAQTSAVMLIYSIMVIILSAIFGCFRWDAKLVIAASMILSGAALCIFHFMTPGTFGLYLMFFMFAIVVSAFFVQGYAVIYEVCDIDAYVSGGKHTGYIVSLFYFISKIMAAVSMFAIGWVLQLVGYDATLPVQSEETLSGISMGTLFISGLTFVIGGIIILKYPGTNKRLNAMRKAMTYKAEGKEYSEEAFKELL